MVRVLVGEAASPKPQAPSPKSQRVAVLECEIDDMNPQIFGVLMDKLYQAGALEVFYVGRADEEEPSRHVDDDGREARAPRRHERDRVSRIDDNRGPAPGAVARVSRSGDGAVETTLGPVRFKVASRDGRVLNAQPEFDDLAKLSEQRGIPIKDAAGAGVQGVARTMKYFLTTAIDFVNSRPHLGTAYEKITADIIARYRRLAGYETHFLMGNDEHSQNVFRKAAEQGKDPLAYCDEMERVFRDVWKRLDLSFDDFIRTTDRRRHFPAVRKMAQACLDNGDIYEGSYEGWYCEGCEAFKPEKDLVDGACPIHKTKPQWIKEKNWFFRLSKYQQPLLEHYSRTTRRSSNRRFAGTRSCVS